MTAKKTTASETVDKQTESEVQTIVSLAPSYMSAILTESFTKSLFPKAKIEDVGSALSERITTIQAGNTATIEAMLISQAQALQTIFVMLGRKAADQNQLPQYTAYMNLALKAQSQSRATIQALTELKYPKQATFVRQANIANGHQQINNGQTTTDNKVTSKRTRAKVIKNQPNELIEANNGSEAMDISATKTTGRVNKAMETVAT